jgi:hypothetical protein
VAGFNPNGVVGTGPDFTQPQDIDVEADGSLIMIDLGTDAVIRIDPDTGDRTTVSQSGTATVGAGPAFSNPWGIAVEPDGNLVVLDGGIDAVFRVDPDTGDRTIISQAGTAGDGVGFIFPLGIAVKPDGSVVVTDSGGAVGTDKVIQVDPVTGDRINISQPSVLGVGPGFTDPRGIAVESSGFIDSDGDGVPDSEDGCPNDANKTDPGVCGCGLADTDSDADSTPDCNDLCPADPEKIDPGVCGCGVADTDTDADGTPDCNDLCPADPEKTDPGVCGCGVPEGCDEPEVIIDDTIEDVQDLVDSSPTLGGGQGNALVGKLEKALDLIDKDKIKQAINKLNAFINQVNSLIENGDLTQAEGQALIDAAEAAFDQLS